MRFPGWCTECRRVRTVRVSALGMGALAARGVATGVCFECEEKAEAERQAMTDRILAAERLRRGRS